MKRANLPVCLLLSMGFHAVLFTCRFDPPAVDAPAPVLVQVRGSVGAFPPPPVRVQEKGAMPLPKPIKPREDDKRTKETSSSPAAPSRPVEAVDPASVVRDARPHPAPPEPMLTEPLPAEENGPGPVQEALSGEEALSIEVPSQPAVRVEAAPIGDYTKPPYPVIARRRGWEGEVLLRVGVEGEGRVSAVEVDRSSGYPVLDRSALRWVETWRFAPATVDGSPVACEVIVPVRFVLEGS